MKYGSQMILGGEGEGGVTDVGAHALQKLHPRKPVELWVHLGARYPIASKNTENYKQKKVRLQQAMPIEVI